MLAWKGWTGVGSSLLSLPGSRWPIYHGHAETQGEWGFKSCSHLLTSLSERGSMESGARVGRSLAMSSCPSFVGLPMLWLGAATPHRWPVRQTQAAPWNMLSLMG